jgi:hypothetical protein
MGSAGGAGLLHAASHKAAAIVAAKRFDRKHRTSEFMNAHFQTNQINDQMVINSNNFCHFIDAVHFDAAPQLRWSGWVDKALQVSKHRRP